MNTYETLDGMARLLGESQAEVQLANKVMHDANGRIMDPRTPHQIRADWQDVYRQWNEFSLACPLLRDSDPRMTREDLRRAMTSALDLKRRGLLVYQRYREVPGLYRPTVARKVSSSGASQTLPGVPAANAKDGRILRGALIGAALLGGCAAGKVLFDSFRKKRELAAAPPAPRMIPSGYGSPYAMPMMPQMQFPMTQMQPFVPAPMYPQFGGGGYGGDDE